MFKFGRWILCTGLLAACDGAQTEELASVHVKSGLISAAQGGVLEVTVADHEALAGTKIQVPPAALANDTRLTIDVWAANLADAESEAAGPAVELGPDGTQFLKPVQITLPYLAGQDPTLLRVFVVESSGARTVLMPEALTVDSDRRLVTFSINHFTRFQCGQGHGPCSHMMCPYGCAMGQCLPPDCSDPAFCGPPPLGGNYLCPDGTLAGPTDCHLLASGVCGYEIIECPLQCQADSDCEANELCVMGTCLVREQAPCMTDAECNPGQACVNNVCVPGTIPNCMSDADCNPGEQCVNGICSSDPSGQNCMTDSDCANGAPCVNGYCGQVMPPACMSDADCNPGEQCVNGICSSNPSGQNCMTDSDCANGAPCVNGYCGQVMPPVCMSDADCAPGQTCQNGLCGQANTPTEVEPNDTLATANGLTLPTTISGAIDPAGDLDHFTFVIPPGMTGALDARLYTTANDPVSCAPGTDSVLGLLDANGTAVAMNDDAHGTMCSHLNPLVGSPQLMPGTYTLLVRAYAGPQVIPQYYVDLALVP